MGFFDLFVRRLRIHTLLDMTCSDGAVGTDVVGLGARHLVEYRATDLHGVVEIFGFDTPSAVVSSASFDGIHFCSRYHLQHFASLLTDVLYPGMAGDVI